MIARLAALAAALVAAALPSPAAGQRLPARAEWRTARWGMTLDEVLKAFPGEATRLEPPVTLKDGNVVAAGIARHDVAGVSFRVRFVFDPRAGLALVSLRTPEKDPATPERFAAVEKALVERFGPAAQRGADDNFVDMRQTTWKTATGRVDVKYIPGTLVILHAAPSQQPDRAEPVPAPVR